MSKLKHYEQPGYWYFITTTTFNGMPIFANRKNAQIIANVLYNLRKRKKLHILSWVIMPEHVHFITVPLEYSLAKIMQELKKSSSRLINRFNNTPGHRIWLSGYHDRVIRDEEELRNKMNYIHLNPVKRGLAEIPEKYFFSSANSFWETDIDISLSGSGTSRTTGER